MGRSIKWLAAGIVAVLPILVAVAHGSEVAVDKVPQVVLEAVHARFTDLKVTGAGKEKGADGK